MSWIFSRELLSFLKNNKESSANNKWENDRPFLPTLIPLILLRLSACDKEIESVLAHIRKRYGDKGSPCLSHWECLKEFVKFPLINKVYWTKDTHSIILLIHFMSKFMTVRIAFKRTLADPTISLRYVYLKHPKTEFFPPPLPKNIYDFIGQEDIIRDVPTLNEGILIWCNNTVYNRLQSINKDFLDYLIDHIA